MIIRLSPGYAFSQEEILDNNTGIISHILPPHKKEDDRH